MIMVHELVTRTAQALSKRGVGLPVFASPTTAGVTLHDTDIIYSVYRERVLEAQKSTCPLCRQACRASSPQPFPKV